MGGIFFGFEKDWTINKHQFQNWRAKDRFLPNGTVECGFFHGYSKARSKGYTRLVMAYSR